VGVRVNRSTELYVYVQGGQVRRDDRFESVFDELFPRAVALAQRILGDRAAAEDAAAEAMARTYARWRRLRDLPYLDGWVLRVTTNVALDVVRRRRPAPEARLPVDESEVNTLRLALAQALLSLPARQREAVSLRYLSGFTEAEVAQALGISAGSVKTHVHRGVAALRERFGDTIEELRLA
jgi:RNA polymerase sigma factor (sigma-70 family)